jgi:hypothetical protein
VGEQLCFAGTPLTSFTAFVACLDFFFKLFAQVRLVVILLLFRGHGFVDEGRFDFNSLINQKLSGVVHSGGLCNHYHGFPLCHH